LVLPVLLLALAGWVDAIGFLAIRGIFPSFMSGNSTTMGVNLAQAGWPDAARIAALIGLFVLGVILGELLIARPRGQARVFLIEALLLWAAALFTALGWRDLLVLLVLGLAMGGQNAAVHRAGGIAVTLTYVTGSLVHFGQACAQALLGRADWRGTLPWASLWLGLMVGSVAGAVTDITASRLIALAIPAVVVTGLAIWRIRDPGKTE
jgi:uncharacterized membrane protein YoaK (UPF0700 family)